MRSIRRRVIALALVTLAAGVGVAVPLTYMATLEDIDELFDERLRQVAVSVAASRDAPGAAGGALLAPPLPGRDADDDDIDLVTEVWRSDGRRLWSTHPQIGLPLRATPGLAQVQLQGRWWHVYAVAADGLIVQVAQPAAERAEFAADAAWNLAAALLLVFAAVAAALVLALRLALAPLDRTAATVASRNEQSLAPIGQHDAPRELRPLLAAIDALLARLADALGQQRRFVADAAHELRTPVTALKLQLAWLERAANPAQRDEALAALHTGIHRAQRLVEQLLDLSRAEPDAPLQMRVVDLADLVQQVVAERAALAQRQGTTLRTRTQGSAIASAIASAIVTQADPHAIATLLRNLVDNALRHGGGGGSVDVAALLIDGRPALRVSDQGPGIAPSERARVFERFYRRDAGGAADRAAPGPGSGLGLAIVKAIADRHGATVRLEDGAAGVGLAAVVVFRPTGAAASSHAGGEAVDHDSTA